MNAFTEQLRAFKPLPSWAEVPKEVKKDRWQLSDETIAKFREAMVGKGWFFRKDLEPILGSPIQRQPLQRSCSPGAGCPEDNLGAKV